MKVSLVLFVFVFIALINILQTHGYVIRPVSLHFVGKAAPGKRFWKPSRLVALSDTAAAFRVCTSPEGCEESESCQYHTMWTADEGETFHPFEETTTTTETTFCGTAGITSTASGTEHDVKDGKVKCISEKQKVVDDGNETITTFEQVEYEVTPGGLLSSAKMEKRPYPIRATFEHHQLLSPEENEDDLVRFRFGDQVAHFAEKNLHFRNVEVEKKNGTKEHVLYKSTDGGNHWEFVSRIPIPFGQESALQRFGETKLLVKAGKPGNYTQTQSIYLGLHWEKIEDNKFVSLMNSYVSPYYTSVMSGIYGRPGVYAIAYGGKKGSEKNINLANFHNRLAHKQGYQVGSGRHTITNFSESFLNATPGNFTALCMTEPHSEDPAEGCQSSSHVSLASTKNGTVFAIYDKLDSGFGVGKAEDDTHEVYAMKLHLNETKEAKDWEERIKENERKKEREEYYEKERIKAEKEKEERRRKERREKLRKDKERRAAYSIINDEFVQKAKEDQVIDDELIVIRDVDPDYLDLEKDFY